MLKRGLVETFLLAMSVRVAQGQIPTGSLNGLVTDPINAAVVVAHVTAVSTAQGFTRLIGEGFNTFNETNIRARATPTTRDAISRSPSRASTAGGFWDSGGPRAFQFAARVDF